MSNFDCQQKMIYSGFFSRFSIRQLPHQQMKHYQRKGTHCNEFRSFKSKKKISNITSTKKFSFNRTWKRRCLHNFHMLPNIKCKKTEDIFRAYLLLKPIPVFSNYHWSKTIWYGNKIACMLCYFAQFRCCW